MNDQSKCQHCEQPVAYGQTEHGYRGFIHETNGLSECPAEALPRCEVCASPVEALAEFSHPDGIQCLTCYADSPAGRRMPTADEEQD